MRPVPPSAPTEAAAAEKETGRFVPGDGQNEKTTEKEERRVSGIFEKIDAVIRSAEYRSQLTEAFYLLDSVPPAPAWSVTIAFSLS